ncbi:MAG: SCO6745 family protein [Cumulibacter sp.]
MSFFGSYFGWRAAPLGDIPAALVTATFYNFSPRATEPGWESARAMRTPSQLLDARERVADRALTRALGDLLSNPELPRTVERLNAALAASPKGGRPLGAANLDLGRDLAPHVALWQATATFRELRGDGHIASLVAHEITPCEAVVFHEADRDPALPGGRMGRERAKESRAWNDDEWAEALDALRVWGLLEADAERLTAKGSELYQLIEDETDDAGAGVWASIADPLDLLAAARPFVHAVIDAGILPPRYQK